MSQMDASYVTDESHSADLMAVFYEDKEAMSELLEKYFYAAFEEKVLQLPKPPLARDIQVHG